MKNFLEVSAAGSTHGVARSTHVERLKNETNCQIVERLILICLLGDVAVVFASQFAACYLRFEVLTYFPLFTKTPLSSYYGFILLGSLVMLFLLYTFNLYDGLRPLRKHQNTTVAFLKAIGIWLLLCSLGSFMLHITPSISRGYILLCGITMFVGLAFWRLLFQYFLKNTRVLEDLKKRVLFVGWTEDTNRLAKTFAQDAEQTHEIIGCILSPSGRFASPPPKGVPLLGEFGDIRNIVAKNKADMVIINELNFARSEIIGLANLCEREMIEFKVVPSFFQILVSGLHLETLHGVPVLAVNKLPLDKMVNLVVKRLVDIAGGIVGLVLSAPLIAVFGFLVYRESPGPVIYSQWRVGRKGGVFKIYKIRSMREDAESDGVAGWSVEDDPRRLHIGGFMRKWNIDELPQFWNVLKGDMSLVGPRPERPEHILNFKEEIPHYNARHNVKPGITGLAQIRGLRGDTDLGERINSDLFYLENWSLVLDIHILLMTFFSRKNAY